MDRIITIDIPDNSKINVDVGTLLSLESILYTASETEDVVVPITSPLNVDSNDIFKHITCLIGSSVKKGDMLASKKGVLSTKKIHSPVEGTVSSINHDTGEMVISVAKSDKISFNSPVEGKVASIDQRGGFVSVSIPTGTEFEVEKVSAVSGGKITSVEVSYLQTDMSQIHKRVVIIPEITPAAASKFEALDAIAIVYHTGSHNSKIPHAKVKQMSDLDKIIKSSQKNLVLLPNIKRIIVY